MTVKTIVYLERMLFRAERARKISGWTAIFFLLIAIADNVFRYLYQHSALFEGVLIGIPIGCWGLSSDHVHGIKKEMNLLCMQTFGKSYESSAEEILKERFK